MRMRWLVVCLMVICLSTAARVSAAADLMAQVPAGDAAYTRLHTLATHALLSAPPGRPLDGRTPSLLNRFDFAFLLIEPMERLNALHDAMQSSSLSPEQRRRKDLAFHALSPLSTAELDTVLTAASHLLAEFGTDIDTLSPGLSARSTAAVRRLRMVMLSESTTPARGTRPNRTTWRISLDPSVATFDPFGDPVPVRSTALAAPTALGMSSARDLRLNTKGQPQSIEAALDVAFGNFRVYGRLTNLPGNDSSISLTSDSPSKAKVGVEVSIAHFKDLGITGILEYHVLRTGAPGATVTDTGAVGGIGLSW